MNIITYLMESRGLVNAAQRLPTIAARFGVTADRMQHALEAYVRLAGQFGAAPTLFVTGNLVERHPHVFEHLAGRQVEFGIHGFVHTDYAALPLDRQRADMHRALSAFRRLGIPADGFRGPYLKWNADSVTAARDLGLLYGSNRGVAWDVIGQNGHRPLDLAAYQKGLRLYGARPSAEALSLPAMTHGLMDMPASLPDDEAIVDRLKFSETDRARVWQTMVDRSHAYGELLVHTLHHERFYICARALESMLAHARSLSPGVWIASLREIGAWWHRRASYTLAIESTGKGAFRIEAPDDAQVTIVARGISGKTEPWHENWSIVPRGALVKAPAAPWIVIPESATTALGDFLREEGFVVQSGKSGDGSLFLDNWDGFVPQDARALLDHIEASDAPLVRLWRWPGGARSALSLSSDVDSMSIVDFMRRPLEV